MGVEGLRSVDDNIGEGFMELFEDLL